MSQFASIAFLGKASEAPAGLRGFINFRAGMEQRELRGDETVAILRIGTTDCYHVLLLDRRPSLADIDAELARIEAVLGADARRSIQKALGEGKRPGK